MSDARKRVLIVYSRVGGGHLSAARALAEELGATGEASTTLVDAYLECGRFPATLFPAAYAWLARDHPHLWWMVYHGSDTRLDATRALRPFLAHGIRRVLRRVKPDLVVSVLPVVNGLLARAMIDTATPARLEVVLTDWHSIHRFWVARGVQHYTVPTESARLDAIRFGAPPERVEVVGIPVRRTFSTPVSPSVHDRFAILAMVGAEGSPRALRNIAELAQLDLNAEMLVLCGRNDALRQHVQELRSRIPVRAIGFVDNVAELMRSADVVVTKAGGLTLAEAFCSGVSVVVHDVVPGQEAGNLEYVVKEHAVEFARSPQELRRIVTGLYGDPSRRAALADAGARLGRPDAARAIAASLLERLGI